jgi:hypothetical protein
VEPAAWAGVIPLSLDAIVVVANVKVDRMEEYRGVSDVRLGISMVMVLTAEKSAKE